ncbi:MAG: c-type cytochrome biogenesis protein CcmI [Celeribacter sp.]|jgi:cytochrome c-type biogenesis protein CcmH
MLFWFIAFALSLLVAGPLAVAMWRGRGTQGLSDDTTDAANTVQMAHPEMALYRDQLAGVERDLARGVLNAEEAERLRTEVSRRLLDADRSRNTDPAVPRSAPRAATLVAMALALVVVSAGSLALYARLGAPGYGDLPLATRLAAAREARDTRPDQAEAEASLGPELPRSAAPEFTELMGKLRAALETRPDDLEGYRLLARNEAALGRYRAAWPAQARVIALMGEASAAEDYAELADLQVSAAGGYVSPEAEDALSAALQRDRQNGPARYYAGLLHAQTGRPDLAYRFWMPLLREGPRDAPWIEPILSQIETVAIRAGETFEMPPIPERNPGGPAQPGPTADDVAAAAQMEEGDRTAMIEGMVEGLAARLADEGGPVEDWARLIRALGVLGQNERARAIRTEAREVFAGNADAQATLDAAAGDEN